MYWKMTFWKTAEITLENMFKNRLNQLWKYSLQFIWGTTLENRRVFLRLYHYIPLCTMGFLQPKIRQTEETMYWKMIFWKTVQITLENIFKTRLNQLWKYSLQVIWGTTLENRRVFLRLYHYISLCAMGGPPTKICQTDQTMYWKMTSRKTAQIIWNTCSKKIGPTMKIESAIYVRHHPWEQNNIPEIISLHILMCKAVIQPEYTRQIIPCIEKWHPGRQLNSLWKTCSKKELNHLWKYGLQAIWAPPLKQKSVPEIASLHIPMYIIIYTLT